jgi:putative membrane protein insertion efficiency factor
VNSSGGSRGALPRLARWAVGLPRAACLLFLRAYKRCLSPLLPAACRFYPTCSEYCREAIERHGALRGGWLGLKRILRCHPLAKGGHDPVP